MVKHYFWISAFFFILLGCGGKGVRHTIRDQGYWPLRSPDSGLLPPGTIAVITRDNPVEFRTICASSDWGVEVAPRTKGGLQSLNAKFEAGAQFDIKKKVPAQITAQYKSLVVVTDVVLSEIPTADLYMKGDRAAQKCIDQVIEEQSGGIKVSVVLGDFRASISYSSEFEAKASVDVKEKVAAAINLGTDKLTGNGAGLVWGIKYQNLPKLKKRAQ